MPNTTNSDRDIVFKLQSMKIDLYAYLGLTIFVIGSIGNVCNIVVFLRLHSISNLASRWLLLASFFGSQLVLNTGVISRVIFGFSGIDPLVSSMIWCKTRWVLGPLGGTTALTCIGLATIDRYCVTSRQIYRHRWMTVQRVRYLILAITFFWLFTLIPNAIYYTSPSCSIKNPVYAQFSSIFSLTTYSIIPLLIMAVFCTLTWHNLQNVNLRTIRLSGIQRQVNQMMIAQICVVLLTTVPNIVSQIYILSTRTIIKSTIRQAKEGLLAAVLSLLGFTAHAGTFYVYLIASRSYRNKVKNIILQCQDRPNRVADQAFNQRQ